MENNIFNRNIVFQYVNNKLNGKNITLYKNNVKIISGTVTETNYQPSHDNSEITICGHNESETETEICKKISAKDFDKIEFNDISELEKELEEKNINIMIREQNPREKKNWWQRIGLGGKTKRSGKKPTKNSRRNKRKTRGRR